MSSSALRKKVAVAAREALDLTLRAGIRAVFGRDGASFYRGADLAAFVGTTEPPYPGGKVTARNSLASGLPAGLVGAAEPGGGGPRVASGLADLRDAIPWPCCVGLVVENELSPELLALARRRGFTAAGANLRPVPVNLVMPAADRCIIKSPDPPPAHAEIGAVPKLKRVFRGSDVVVHVSLASAVMAEAAMTFSNGASHVMQPTGALHQADTLRWLPRAHDVVINYTEFLGLLRMADIPHDDAPSDENAADTFEATAVLLPRLHNRQLAGALATVITMGRNGCVVADWQRGTITAVRVNVRGSVSTPVGAGDAFLAGWVFDRWLLRNGACPVAAARAATRSVAEFLGLQQGQYSLEHSALIARMPRRVAPGRSRKPVPLFRSTTVPTCHPAARRSAMPVGSSGLRQRVRSRRDTPSLRGR
jgi:sugar/nucleoside kinase (ribokinase family)